MTYFIPKKLPLEETPGERLRQARRYKNLKIEEVAKAIGIRAEYLLALEEERFDLLPAGLYGKNFFKEYALYLGLKPEELIKDRKGELFNNQSENPFSQKIVKRGKFIIFPKIIRNVLIFVIIFSCFLYLIFYAQRVIFPPELIITNPEKNILISEPNIAITGRTEPEAEVKINGESVLNNNNGYFSQIVNLKPGVNNIIITAQKKYSRVKTVTRQILVK